MVDVPSRDEFNALTARVTKLEQTTPPNPQPPTPSPDGTQVTDTTGRLVDKDHHVFQLVTSFNQGYQITMDGGVPTGAQVLRLYAKTGFCYQENNQHGWWRWENNDWQPTNDPTATNPAPTYKFADEFVSNLSLWNAYAPDSTKTWQLSRWYGNDWFGWQNGDGWMVNPWNADTPYPNLYKLDGQSNLALGIAKTPANVLPKVNNAKYLTSQVNSFYAQLGGYWEARIKCPNIPGTNFAFWLMNHKSWPPEIDIVEAVNHGDWTLMSQTVWHMPNQGNNDNYSLFKDGGFMIDAWHTYGCYWDVTKHRIQMFFDGRKTLDVAEPQGYTDPMFIILSTQCGGDWAGPIPDGAQLGPLLVDYVRVSDHPSG